VGKSILRIEAAELVGPHSLLLRFSDGASRRVDLRPHLTGPVFEPLQDPRFFSRVVLDPVCGTVVWPNGADFAPEFLREIPAERVSRPTKRSPNTALQRTGRAASRR
jgi:Protein of unknown function (DUF2442)